MGSNAIKIGWVLLVVGVILFFVIFRGRVEQGQPSAFSGPSPAISDLTLSPTSSPTASGATTTNQNPPSPPVKETKVEPTKPALSSTKRPTPPAKVGLPPEGTTPELAKCEFQEFIVTIFSNSDARPASLTVHSSDTVTFINEDNALHWPGADPHPTHSELPGFDATGGISKDQTYSYTFKKAGKFGWHEHLIENNSPTIGFITVLACQV